MAHVRKSLASHSNNAINREKAWNRRGRVVTNAWLLNGNPLQRHGKFKKLQKHETGEHTHGRHRTEKWQTHGKSMANRGNNANNRATHQAQGNTWQTQGREMPNVLQINARPLQNKSTRKKHSKGVVNPWQKHGICMASRWQTMANA